MMGALLLLLLLQGDDVCVGVDDDGIGRGRGGVLMRVVLEVSMGGGRADGGGG
jgi:hypothetical protein